ncbi:MAG: hypothetical protein AAGL89_03005, partial [Pseudomonadota bacterium]
LRKAVFTVAVIGPSVQDENEGLAGTGVMGLVYLVMYFVTYVVPLIGSLLLVWVLAVVVFRRRRWAWSASFICVAVASSVPWMMDRIALRQELAAYASDTIYPNRLRLEPGALWHIEEGNHAGVTCSWECDFTRLPFVTEVGEQDVGYALQLDTSGAPIDQHNLWDGLYDLEQQPGQAFPYQYAYIGLSQYRDFGVPQSGDYRMPHWPETGKGVHMLVRIPSDGMLNFETAEVLYRRYNVQREMALLLLWGVATETVQTPGTDAIFNDLVAIAGD